MKNYTLKILIDFEEQDDPSASQRAWKMLDLIQKLQPRFKLQETFENKKPRGVRL